MSELTDEELTAIEDQCDGFSMLILNPAAQRDVRSMIAELRSLRGRALTAVNLDDSELHLVCWALGTLSGDHNDAPHNHIAQLQERLRTRLEQRIAATRGGKP